MRVVNFIQENMEKNIYFYLKDENIMKLLGNTLISIINQNNYIYHPHDKIFIIKNEYMFGKLKK